MAQPWESPGIKRAGENWRKAYARGDRKGMAAAENEANRIRRAVEGYSLNGRQPGAIPAMIAPNTFQTADGIILGMREKKSKQSYNPYQKKLEESEENSKRLPSTLQPETRQSTNSTSKTTAGNERTSDEEIYKVTFNPYQSFLKPQPAVKDAQELLNQMQYNIRHSAEIIQNEAEARAEAEKNRASFGTWLKNSTFTGLSRFTKGVTETLDLLPTEYIFGEEHDPLHWLAETYAKENEYWEREKERSDASRGKGWETAGDLVAMTSTALPSAVMALAAAPGAAAGAVAGEAATVLNTLNSSGLGQTVLNSLSTLSSNPMFWTTAVSTLGPEYNYAKETGASDTEAAAAALIATLLNSATEVSGGMETLPAQLRGSGRSGILQLVRSAVHEGGENVLQSIISFLTQGAVYDSDKRLYSREDPTAVMNPERALQEFGTGTAVGAILGGGQMGSVKLMDNVRTGLRGGPGGVGNGLSSGPGGVGNASGNLSRFQQGAVGMADSKLGSIPESALEHFNPYRKLIDAGLQPAGRKRGSRNAVKAYEEERGSYIKGEKISGGEETRYRDFLNAADKRTMNFARRAITGKASPKADFLLSMVGRKEAGDLARLTGTDVSRYHHSAKPDAFQEIVKRHGFFGTEDNSMANMNDIGRISYVLSKYDSVDVITGRNTPDGSGKPRAADAKDRSSGIPLIEFRKRIGNQDYVVQMALDERGKHLWLVDTAIETPGNRLLKNQTGANPGNRTIEARLQAGKNPGGLARKARMDESRGIQPRKMQFGEDRGNNSRRYQLNEDQQNAIQGSRKKSGGRTLWEAYGQGLTQQAENSGAYPNLSDYIVKTAKRSGIDVDEAMKQIAFDSADKGVMLSPAEIRRKFVEKYGGRFLLQDTKSIRQLAHDDPELFQQIYGWVVDNERGMGLNRGREFLPEVQKSYEEALNQMEDAEGVARSSGEENEGTKEAREEGTAGTYNSKIKEVKFNGSKGSRKTGTVWDNIRRTANNIPNTKIPATFGVNLDDNIKYVNPETGTNELWTNANATEHMGEYVRRFGAENWRIDIHSQIIIESYSASLNEAMYVLSLKPAGRYFGIYGNWELGINTQTGAVYHAMIVR